MSNLNRRLMLAGAAASVPALAQPQTPNGQPSKPLLGTPLSVITNPARDFGPNAPPPASPDPDIIRADPSFGGLLIGQFFLSAAGGIMQIAMAILSPAWAPVVSFSMLIVILLWDPEWL